MAQPIVTFRNPVDPTATIPSYPIGEVDVGIRTPEFPIDIWNNYAGEVDVSNMQNTRITVKDSAGGDNLEMVKQKWIEVKNLSQNEVVYTPVGGTDGVDYGNGMVGKEHTIGAETMAAGQIGGYVNDGEKETADTKRNFCSLVLQTLPPLNATAGTSDFLIKLGFKYT